MKLEWHKETAEKVLEQLGTTANGLDEAKAEGRLKVYGYNELKEKKRYTSLKIFLSQFKSFLVIMLLIATLISYLIGDLIDATIIFAIVVLSVGLGFTQEYRAERTLKALKKLVTPKAKIIRNSELKLISSKELVPGDILLIEAGDKIPADARIIELKDLRVDESSITGESVPVSKSTSALDEVALADRKNMLYQGSLITYGKGKAVVVSTGMQTEMGKIAARIQEAKETTPLQAKLSKFGIKLGLVIVGIALLTFLIGFFRDIPIYTMFLISVALAVAAVPEGLPAVVTVTLALGVQRMARRNSLVRKLAAVETLGATTIICADKTGTMTTNEMTVRKIWVGGKTIEVTGVGFIPEGEFTYQGKRIEPLKDENLELLFKTCILCNNAELAKEENRWKIIGDPTEGTLIVLGQKAGLTKKSLPYERIDEIPFASERKMMTTVYEIKNINYTFVKGAPEVILEKCTQIKEDKTKKLTQANKEKILQVTEEMAKSGLRTIAFAFKPTSKEPEEDLIFLGLAGMIDPPREETKKAVEICKQAGIRVIMLTGDHKLTALAIAKEIGLETEKAITGIELEKMSDDELEFALEKTSVFARVSPQHKVRIVSALKKKGHIVAVTGDGINDAPALKDSHIGVAMGIKGTDVTKEASDMILLDDNFASIVTAADQGRGIYANIRKFVRFLLSANFGEIGIIVFAVLAGLPLPLLAAQILWINLITDGLPAMALSVDPNRGMMKRKPRNPKEGILHNTIPFILVAGLVAALAGLGIFLFEYFTTGDLAKARTMVFTQVVLFELLFVFNCRSEEKSVFSLSPLTNKYLVLAVLMSILLQVMIIYIPFFQPFFHTTPLALVDWLIIAGVACSSLLILPRFFFRQK